MKGMSGASYILGVELHIECFEIFFYGKQLPSTFDKGNYTLWGYSWGKINNYCYPIIILGHYSCDLNLAMPFEVLLFWLAWYLTLAGIVSKWKENPEMIVGIIGNTYGVMSRNHGFFIIVWWSQSLAALINWCLWKEDLHER